MNILKLPDDERERHPEKWMGLNQWDGGQVFVQYYYSKYDSSKPEFERGVHIHLNEHGLNADVPVDWVVNSP